MCAATTWGWAPIWIQTDASFRNCSRARASESRSGKNVFSATGSFAARSAQSSTTPMPPRSDFSGR